MKKIMLKKITIQEQTVEKEVVEENNIEKEVVEENNIEKEVVLFKLKKHVEKES